MKTLLPFIVATCLLSWIYAGVGYWQGMNMTNPFYIVFGGIYMWFPAIVALVLQKWVNKKPIAKSLGVNFKFNWWFAAAIVTPLLMIGLTFIVNLSFPGIDFSSTYEGFQNLLANKMTDDQVEIVTTKLNEIPPTIYMLIIVFSGIFAGCTINAFFAFGEELGWRGYMLQHLQNWKFLPASLLIGSVWGVWHFPIILMGHNYPIHNIVGVALMTVFCILLTPTIMYITIKSRTVLTAAIFHGTMNAVAGLPLLYLKGGDDLTLGFTGYAGFIAILLVTAGFYLYDRFYTKEKIFSSRLEK